MLLKNKNFAKSILASGIAADAVSVTVAASEGSLFPQTGSFRGVIWGANFDSPLLDASREIVTATFTAGDTFTIVRHEENTSAKIWSAGDHFAIDLTAGKIDELESIFPNIAAKTSNYAVTAADCNGGKVFTNEGAAGMIEFTLPSAVANMKVSFVVQDSDGLKIIANTGDTIRFMGAVTAAAGAIKSDDIGNTITLICINAAEWIALDGLKDNYGIITGTDTYAIIIPFLPALYQGFRIHGKVANANTSTVPTLNVNSIGAKKIFKEGGSALAAGDIPAGHHADFSYDTALDSGNGGWLLLNPKGSSGGKIAGDIVQVVNYQTGAMATGTTVAPYDDTIMQKTEGDEYLTYTITPTNTNNKLLILVEMNLSHSYAGSLYMMVGLFQDAIASAIKMSIGWTNSATVLHPTVLIHDMVAGTVSEITFKIRAGGHQSGTTTFNGAGGGRLGGGVLISSITIMEIKV